MSGRPATRDTILRLRSEGRGVGEIAAAVGVCVRRVYQVLGVSRPKTRLTPHDRREIISLLTTYSQRRVALMVRRDRRTVAAVVAARREVLGEAKVPKAARRPWTAAEVECVRAKIGVTGAAALARELGRSKSSVQTLVKRLGA